MITGLSFLPQFQLLAKLFKYHVYNFILPLPP